MAKARLLDRLGRIGVDHRVPAHEARFVVVTNQAAAAAFVLVAATMFIPSPPGSPLPFVLAAMGLCTLGVIGLNRIGQYRTARIFFPTCTAAAVLAGTFIAGPAAEFQIFLVGVAAGAWFVVPPSDRRLAIVVCILALVLLATVEIFSSGIHPIAPAGPRMTEVIVVINHAGLAFIVVLFAYYSYTQTARAESLLMRERARSEELLLNVLPAAIAERLKTHPGLIADRFDAATVLFADLVNFTPLSARMPAADLVRLLDEVFSRFDALADQHGLEKIKTIGDAYMVAGGIPVSRTDHVEAVASMALDMRRVVEDIGRDYDGLSIRIGIHTGPVVAGVIGRRKFIYDLWGDSVNTASRMESHGEPSRIHVTRAVYDAIRDRFDFQARGTVLVKGKGEMETFFLEGRKAGP